MRKSTKQPAPASNDLDPAEVLVVRHDVGGRHWYEALRGDTRERIGWLASVTHYCGQLPKGELFERWLAEKGWDQAEKIKKEAGERGSNVHAGIECLLRGATLPLADFTEKEWHHLRAFVNWVEDFQPVFEGCEEIVYDLDEGVAGTVDHRYTLPKEIVQARLKVAGLVEDLHVLGDVKTGKALYEENYLQVNKYAHLHNRLHPANAVSHYALLRTHSKHRRHYEYVVEPLSAARLQAFDALKTVVDHVEPATVPTFPEALPETLALPGVCRTLPLDARNGSKRSRH